MRFEKLVIPDITKKQTLQEDDASISSQELDSQDEKSALVGDKEGKDM